LSVESCQTDDRVRRESVETARLALRPPLLDPVLERLIERLRHERPAVRQRAAASLTELGSLAALAVVRALVRGRNPQARARLTEVLADLGQHLGREARLEVARALESVWAATRHATLASACAATIKALGCADDAGELTDGRVHPAGPYRPDSAGTFSETACQPG
jgi:hypothetical protein